MVEYAYIIFDIAYYISLIAILLSFIRFYLGPTAADRVVALDVITICGINLIIQIAMRAGRIVYVDVALVYALLSFLGVISVARYLEGGL
ncbi:MAG: monovalent cation/H+ antiporter complex subunit F [Candidatus Cloacimonetes bacterium]|nr:monovalent cation/H+ antiporter complex subunit F [Candidatus Cloacimonadota bacterium]